MRRFGVLLTLMVFALVTPAFAGHKPNSYCSSTGDICQSTQKVNGIRKLRISTAADYFNRYKLCVKAPDDSRDCDTFRMQRDGSIYKDSVRWSRHFPKKSPGPYTVTWKATSGSQRYGRRLGFHR